MLLNEQVYDISSRKAIKTHVLIMKPINKWYIKSFHMDTFINFILTSNATRARPGVRSICSLW